MECDIIPLNSAFVSVLMVIIVLFNNYFKNDDENDEMSVYSNINNDDCDLSDISCWGQYIIIDK